MKFSLNPFDFHIRSVFVVMFLAIGLSVQAQEYQNSYNQNKFKQLKEELPTPNVYRTASGAPGHEYYQQKADYEMDITLDDEKQIVAMANRQVVRDRSKVKFPDKLKGEEKETWVELQRRMKAIPKPAQGPTLRMVQEERAVGRRPFQKILEVECGKN